MSQQEVVMVTNSKTQPLSPIKKKMTNNRGTREEMESMNLDSAVGWVVDASLHYDFVMHLYKHQHLWGCEEALQSMTGIQYQQGDLSVEV